MHIPTSLSRQLIKYSYHHNIKSSQTLRASITYSAGIHRRQQQQRRFYTNSRAMGGQEELHAQPDFPASPARELPQSGFEIIDDKYLVDEETLPGYKPEDFYPVKIGEIFQSRYQVLGKLGFGTVSTVWLCRDLIKHRYVSLKVYSNFERQSSNEEKAFKHIAKFREGGDVNATFVRSMLDSFSISWENGNHRCLVQEPMAMTLDTFAKLCKINIDLAQVIMQDVIRGVYFLHTVANVVHTDIQGSNIMMSLDSDDLVLKQFEEEQMSTPSPRKTEGDRMVYASKGIRIPSTAGSFVLCDLGEAHFGGMFNTKFYFGEVMPNLYRAPEVCLCIRWSEKIDIWALALVLWYLIEGKQLFRYYETDREASVKFHLARMIALLGPPPKELLLQGGNRSKEFFDEDGKFKHSELIPDISLESEMTALEGEEKAKFLVFIRRILQWRPELRPTTEDLFEDPWLGVVNTETNPVNDDKPL